MNSVFPPCETAVQPPLPCASARSAPAGSKRVLVLDDDAATRRLIALLLARAGYTVDLSEDGEMGWDALRCAHYDLLVTDNDMPRLNGLQLTQRLRFAGMKLPVIIASGSIELGEAEDYGWLELTAILHKPFHLAELIATARRAAPIPPDAAEGAVHSVEPQRDASTPLPLPARSNARAETFAQTA